MCLGARLQTLATSALAGAFLPTQPAGGLDAESTSSWVNVLLGLDHRDLIKPPWRGNRLEWKDKPLRSGSTLERRLRAGEFAVTVEIDPPNDAGIDEFLALARALSPLVIASRSKWVIKRLEGVPKEKQRAEGVVIAIEIVQQLREIEGVAGVHLTAMYQKGKAEAIRAIGEAAGFLPRPPLNWPVEAPVASVALDEGR